MRFIDNVNEWVGRICSFVIVVITLIVVYEVIMRYVFNSPTIWSFETTVMLYSFYFMIVAAYTLLHGDHVSVDFFYEKQSRRRQTVLDIISYLIFFFPFMIVIFIEGYKFAADSWSIREVSWSVFGAPVYPVKTFIPVTAFLLLIQGFSIFMGKIYFLMKKGEVKP